MLVNEDLLVLHILQKELLNATKRALANDYQASDQDRFCLDPLAAQALLEIPNIVIDKRPERSIETPGPANLLKAS